MVDLFAQEPVNVQDMLGCARRELKMRKSVYPHWVSIGKISAEEAERETRTMAAIVAHFEGVVAQDRAAQTGTSEQ